jgi:hypothetical protein
MTTCIKSNKLCSHVLAIVCYKITFIDELKKKLMFHFLKQKNHALDKLLKYKIYTKIRHVKPWLENCNANWNNFIEHNVLPIMLLTKQLWFDRDILFLGLPLAFFSFTFGHLFLITHLNSIPLATMRTFILSIILTCPPTPFALFCCKEIF